MIIILAALAAESDGHEQATRPGERLPFKRELSRDRRFKGGIHGAALADELVQLESERHSAVVAAQLSALRQQFTQAFATDFRGRARRLGQMGGGIRERAGQATAQATAFLRLDAELTFRPAGQRVTAKFRQRCGHRRGE